MVADVSPGLAPDAGDALKSMWNDLLKASNTIVSVPRPRHYERCSSRDDVRRLLKVAAQHTLKTSPKGSGHSYAGVALVENGLLLDLKPMGSITIDAQSRTATVQPGAVTKDLRKAVAKYGLHFPFGHISPVGLAGFTLGGGQGWGSCYFGSACDNVLEFELASVDASGDVTLQRVSAESDPELFWGLCGGAAFLGVVTEMKLKLHPVPAQLPQILATFHMDAMPQVVELLLQLTGLGPSAASGAAPPRESTEWTAVWMIGPEGEPVVGLTGVAFTQEDARMRLGFERVRALCPELRLSLSEGPQPYEALLSSTDEPWMAPGAAAYATNAFLPAASLAGAGGAARLAALQDQLRGMTSQRSFVILQAGGPAGGPPCAFGFRGMLYLGVYAIWTRTPGGAKVDADAAHAAWAKGVADAVADATAGCYLNESMLERPGDLERCFEPEALRRLKALKQKVDPRGMFRSLT